MLATLSLISGVISDLPLSRSDLIVENALLRQQLIVLHRQVNRPLLTQHDRFRIFDKIFIENPKISDG